jgi:hypothetical protein
VEAATPSDATRASAAALADAATPETAATSAKAATTDAAAPSDAAPDAAAKPDVTPEAVTPPAEPPVADHPSLEKLKRGWNLVLQQLETRDATLYGALKEARPTELAHDVLTIAVPSDFALRKVREPANTELLTTALHEVSGGTFTVDYVVTERERAGAAPPPAPQKSLSLAEKVKMVEQTLDARVLPEEE